MNSRARNFSEVIALLLLSGTAVVADASNGALDENGCHEGAKTGDYHCHEGPLVGRSFRSKDEAERALQGKGGKDAEEPPRETLEERKAISKPAAKPSRRPARKPSPKPPDGERRAP